jgi:uncharacterized protein with HEPN domain
VRDSRERVLDILNAVERIEKYAVGSREEFERNELVQVWILHYLQILGEAVNALRPELQHSHPEIPWAPIVGMRNVLVHQYFEIDTDIIWTVMERELPEIKTKFQAILDQLGPE